MKKIYSKELYDLLKVASKMKRLSTLIHHKSYTLLLEETNFLSANTKIIQRLWHVQNNTNEIPTCKVCKVSVSWYQGKKIYSTYCSPKCRELDPLVRKKYKQTMIDRYGVQHNWQHGVLREQQKQTMIDRHEAEYPIQNKQIKKKIKQTMIDRYGVQHNWQHGVLREQQKQTMIDRHGVEWSFQSEVLRNKGKQTNLKRFGVESHFQKHILGILPLLNHDWLYNQYVIQKKTALQLAQELHVDGTTIGNYLRKFEIQIQQNKQFSFKCIQWLESVMKEQNVFIQHAQNGGEYKIPDTRLRVDGYCKENNTIYEFYGDLWHGNPNVFESNHQFLYQTAEERYYNTLKREKIIRELNYNLIIMWEADWYQTTS